MQRFHIIISFLLFSLCQVQAQNKKQQKLDSIQVLRQLSMSMDYDLEDRFTYAKRASELSNKLKIDSTVLKSNKNLSFIYGLMGEDDSYKRINFESLKLAQKIKDSSSIATVYYSLGYYHHIMKQQNDSAYYYYSNAIELYDQLKDKKNSSAVLINIAIIQQVEKDYIGSQESAIRAIEILQKLNKTESVLDNLWILNGLLGLNATSLKLYDKALEYHEKAINISDDMELGEYNRLYAINNQAFVYRELGNTEKAIELYKGILKKENFFEEDPSFYALILENIAYTRFLNGDKKTADLENIFHRAYKISDSIDDPITKVGVTISMAKFYETLKVKDSALKYALETYKVSKEIESNDILLESLILLSKLKEGEDGKVYLNEHIKLSDSLLNVERNVRNKFARIKFETEQIEQDNQRMSREKMWLSVVSLVLLVTLFLLYIIITQRAKNKELRFRQEQQEANEEIYNLMLSQQDKVDEARAGEKKRISKELHDGILGRLFGTRLSLDSLNMSEGKDAIENRANYISELKIIEQDIRQISHELSTDFVSGSGFMDIITELIEKQTEVYQLKYKFNYSDDINWEMVLNKTKINIYRIIQESLQNIYKHANAKAVKISIKLKNSVICLVISDDGQGFEMSKSKKGIGLKNIDSRVGEFQGELEIDSQINKGTVIEIKIPYTN